MARPRKPREPLTYGYIRVSTDEQADRGVGAEAQRAAVREVCERKGLVLHELVEDLGWSGGTLTAERAGLGQILPALKRGDRLVVARLDRLGRVTSDVAGLVERAAAEGWGIVIADMDVDSATPTGRLVLGILGVVAAFERDLVRERTRDALAARRSQGVRTGRASSLPAEVRARIATELAGGATLQAVADRLNADRIPTARGGTMWRPSAVAAVRASVELDAELAAARTATG